NRPWGRRPSVRRTRTIRRLLTAAALAVPLVLAASAPALAASVSAVDFHFVPKTVTINVGDTVTWSNNGKSPHTVTANGGSFNSGNLNPGQSFSHTFTSAGTFAYHCQYHQNLGMVG